ncbi:hypothetical protein [Dactylosporangium sp. NPDC000521]|uniref:hypothetical protein n=1 Tax=Dactylosporangium sp. NPDC000521 TaxID=3363975 RepID=UPI0036C45087
MLVTRGAVGGVALPRAALALAVTLDLVPTGWERPPLTRLPYDPIAVDGGAFINGSHRALVTLDAARWSPFSANGDPQHRNPVRNVEALYILSSVYISDNLAPRIRRTRRAFQ